MDQGPIVAENVDLMESIYNIAKPSLPKSHHTIKYEMVRYENTGGKVTDSNSYKVWTTDDAFMVPKTAIAQVDCRLRVENTVGAGDWRAIQKSDHIVLASNGFQWMESARLAVNDVTVEHHTDSPGKLAHMRLLVESGKDYVKTVGKTAHYYLDSVSDRGVQTTVQYTPAPASNAGGVPVVTPGAPVYVPRSFVDEIQYELSPLSATQNGVNNIVISARKNPNYDEAFAEKLNRAIQANGEAANMILLLPLRDIFSFLDYDGVMRSSRFEFEFTKNTSSTRYLFGHTLGGRRIELVVDRLALWMAKVTPSPAALSLFESLYLQQKVTEYNFENVKLYRQNYTGTEQGEQRWRVGIKQQLPTKVIFGFQFGARETDHQLNPLQFDLLGANGGNIISRIELLHNGTTVPHSGYRPTYDYPRIVQDLHRIGYKENDIADSACITVDNWSTMYPLFGFSVEANEGDPNASRSLSSLELVWTTNNNAAMGYNVFALVYSEAKAYIDNSTRITTIKMI